MTPKEKSKELIDKYVGFKLNPYNDPEMSQTLYIAKKNALICVDEFIDALSFNSSPTAEGLTEFYEKVKQEIYKL